MKFELRECPEDNLTAYCSGICDGCRRKLDDSEDFFEDCFSKQVIDLDESVAKTNDLPSFLSDDEVPHNFFSNEWKKITASLPTNKENKISVMLETTDNVNHPSHYNMGKYEVIDIIKDKMTSEQYYGFLCGNIIKYITRWQNKNGLEDLKKAHWYLERLIEEKEKGNEEDR